MKAIAIGSLLLGGLCFASAQVTPIAAKQGVYSLGFSFDWFSPQHGSSTTTLNIDPAYFITNNISLGVPVMWTHTSGFDSTSIGVEGRFFFMNASGGQPPQQFQPFVGAIVQWFHETGGSNDTFWGGEIGAHYFVANNVALTGDLTIGQDRAAGITTSSTEFFAGFTIFFAGFGK